MTETGTGRPSFVLADKPRGWSPLDVVRALRAEDPSLATARMGYAGRLDPLAEGLLVLLVDDENRRAADWCGLDKTYAVTFALGLATDTHDLLGLATRGARPPGADDTAEALAWLVSRVGPFVQTPPAFSSARAGGRASFHWARRGLAPPAPPTPRWRSLDRVSEPCGGAVSAAALRRRITEDLAQVRGAFRQSEIRSQWDHALDGLADDHAFPTLDVTLDVSSGVYVRGLAEALGRALGTGAVALRIRRTRVGPHTLAAARTVSHRP